MVRLLFLGEDRPLFGRWMTVDYYVSCTEFLYFPDSLPVLFGLDSKGEPEASSASASSDSNRSLV